MPKSQQESLDEWAAKNRQSVERELFEPRNRSQTAESVEEYIKFYDKSFRKRLTRGSDENETEGFLSTPAAAKYAKWIRRESDEFWRNYFQNKTKSTHQSRTGTINKKGRHVANPSISEGQDGLDKSNWETWWLRSPLWRRLMGFLLTILLFFFLAQFGTMLFLLGASIIHEGDDPYVCKTTNCLYLSTWFKDSTNLSVSPCDDFYHFVCGNHRNDNDDGLFNEGGEWDLYSAPLEFGRQNVLAEILKNIEHDKMHDQPITYYQTCLDPRLREQHGLSGYRNLAEILFADINEIDTSSKTLEEMAVNVTKTVGDFGFFEFEFDGHPTILITTHVMETWTEALKEDGVSNLKSLMIHLFPNLLRAEEISQGVVSILAEIGRLFLTASTATKKEDLCSPSNARPFDLDKVGRLYSEQEGEELSFPRETDEFYYYGLTNCWKPTGIPDSLKKSSFAMFWMVRILIFTLPELSTSEFQKIRPYMRNMKAFLFADAERKRSLENQCFHSLTKHFGYIPVHRYFQKLGLHPQVFADEVEEYFRRNSKILNTFWLNDTVFPHIDSFSKKEGSKLLSFEDPVYFFSNIPVQNDIIIENAVDLGLTNDHFQNSINGKRFTLRQAKFWWTNIHDKRHVLLWNSQTFDLQKSYSIVSPIDKVNAIFLPISYFLEPYDSDILAIRNGGSTVVIMRKILDYLSEYLGKANLKKKYKTDASTLKKNDSSQESCVFFGFTQGSDKYGMFNTTKGELFNTNWDLFANVLAIKTAHFDSIDRQYLSTHPYDQLSPKYRRWDISRKLIGQEEFTEEQLFFMAIARHFCRQRPLVGKSDRAYKQYVANMLATFMQLNEFSTAWKCPPRSRMNPPNKCFE